MEPAAEKEKRKENPFTATFIFVAAVHARLATVLTGPLCKLQSEAGPRFACLFSGRGGEEGENRGLRLADMESAETAFGIYIYIYIYICVCVCVYVCPVMHFYGIVYVDEKTSKHILGVPIGLWVRCCMRTTLDNRCKPRKRLCERAKGPAWSI